MDMKLNRNRIRAERRKRAWSQAHLAGAAGLGIRTVQRIETTGAASYDSARALAAVFSLSLEEIAELPQSPQDRSQLPKAAAAVVAMVLFASTCVFIAGNSWAEQVMLHVGVSQNNGALEEGQLLIAEGKEAEMRMDDSVRVLIAPTIQDDGKVFLAVRIFELLDGKSTLISEPRLITADNKEAEIRVDGSTGNTFRVLVTPRTSD